MGSSNNIDQNDLNVLLEILPEYECSCNFELKTEYKDW